jgi:preprotein translocase subunit SecG
LEGFLLTIHIIVCLLLIIVVLLQSGKSADLAGAFGGAGSQSTFGPRGTATLLSKMTTILAIMFMVLTLLLMIVASRKTNVKSVLDKEEVKQEEKQEGVQPPSREDQDEKKSTDSSTQ